MPTSAAGSGGIAAYNGGSKKENAGKGNSMTSITKFLVPRIGGIVPEEETNALVLVCGDFWKHSKCHCIAVNLYRRNQTYAYKQLLWVWRCTLI
jgi:hypothetical protein